MNGLLRHPVLLTVLVLSGLTLLWVLIGAPISLITQIAIYTLYGAGVCLLRPSHTSDAQDATLSSEEHRASSGGPGPTPTAEALVEQSSTLRTRIHV